MQTFLEKIRYWFDNAMSKGLASLIGLLLVITLLFVGLMTVLVVIFSAYPDQGTDFWEMFWFSLMHALYPGTVVGDYGFAYRTVMLITTFGGLIFVAGLIGLMMSQISENAKLEDVFKYLFSSDGSEINLLPASWYVKAGAEIDMHVLIGAAAKRGDTALGYRLKALEKDSEQVFGIHLNPNKSEKFVLGSEDRVVVLAEG